MEKINGISLRINQILVEVFNGNQSAFARSIDVGESRIRSYINGTLPKADVLDKITTKLAISCEWLIRGVGVMLRQDTPEVKTQRVFPLRTDRSVDNQLVPLYDLEATAGLVALFMDGKITPTGYVSIPDLPPCDGALHVRGDSMYPLLKSGDIILYKQVQDMEYGIFWGEIYLVSFEVDGEEYVMVKYVQKSEQEGCIRLVSHNAHHAPQDIPRARIRAIALVKASVRYNTIR